MDLRLAYGGWGGHKGFTSSTSNFQAMNVSKFPDFEIHPLLWNRIKQCMKRLKYSKPDITSWIGMKLSLENVSSGQYSALNLFHWQDWEKCLFYPTKVNRWGGGVESDHLPFH